jgi:hypothetical protein
VKLTDCTIKRNVSELFIHVVNASSRLISQDDSEGLDMIGSSFKNLINGKDLALSALRFELSSKMIPEFRLSNNIISSKESNSIDLWV